MARNSFSFTVFGYEPRPQGSKKYVGSRRTAAGNNIPLIIEASPGLPVWRKAVSDAVVLAMHDSGDMSKFDGAVKVEAVFYVTRKRTVTRDLPTVPPDVDKLSRALLDSCKPVWKDDSQVVRLEVSKKYATKEAGVAVTITNYSESV
jgi:Holliday junction resolvase RusA-like endonuclease